MKKKGLTVQGTIVGFVILLLVAAILIFIFRSSTGRQVGSIDAEIATLGDTDFDGVSDRVDKCVCEPGPAGTEGCSNAGIAAERTTKCQQYKDCQESNPAHVEAVEGAGLTFEAIAQC